MVSDLTSFVKDSTLKNLKKKGDFFPIMPTNNNNVT